MNMEQAIKDWLLSQQDYKQGLQILQDCKASQSLKNYLARKQNPDKLKYILVKNLNILIPEKITELNYQQILKPDKPTKQKQVKKDLVKQAIESQANINKVEKILPDEISDEQYKELYKKLPEKIQKLIVEKGKATRKRAQLHKECKEIKGNSNEAKEERKEKLDEMDLLTIKIKEIHEIVKEYEKLSDSK